MERIKVAPNFCLDEFVAPEIYNLFGSNSIWFVNPVIIKIAQYLREQYGVAVINNWSQKGKIDAKTFLSFEKKIRDQFFAYSGTRPMDCIIGAKYSQHKFGNAIDPKFVNATPEKIRTNIKKKWSFEYQKVGITAIEDKTKTWLHVSCQNTGLNKLMIFNP